MGRWEIAGGKGFSPALVLTCGLAALSTYVVTRILVESGHAWFRADLPAILGQAFCAVAYVVGWTSCRCASALYPRNSPMRLGWLALGTNCVLSVFRHTVLNPLFEPLAGSTDRVYFLSQTFLFPALTCALLGLLAIWWGFHRLGLGFHGRWTDCAGVLVLATLLTWIFRGYLSHSRSGAAAVMILQQLNLVLLLSIGGVGLMLHHLAMQMGGGRMAVVMRSVAIYALSRSLLTLSQGDREAYAYLWWVCFYAAPWVFVFGAAYFCWLAETVRRSIGRQAYWDWKISD